MIGSFGDIIFETNDKRIMTFDELRRESQTDYAEHRVIGKKPRLEFISPNLDTITFTVSLNGIFSVKPREEAAMWLEKCRSGEANYLIVGETALGVDMWVIVNLGAGFSSILNDGKIVKTALDITLKEYISYEY